MNKKAAKKKTFLSQESIDAQERSREAMRRGIDAQEAAEKADAEAEAAAERAEIDRENLLQNERESHETAARKKQTEKAAEIKLTTPEALAFLEELRIRRRRNG